MLRRAYCIEHRCSFLFLALKGKNSPINCPLPEPALHGCVNVGVKYVYEVCVEEKIMLCYLVLGI